MPGETCMEGFSDGATALPDSVNCSVPMASVELCAPACAGANATVNVVVSPGFNVTGKVGTLVRVNPAPDKEIDEIVCDAKLVAGFETTKI